MRTPSKRPMYALLMAAGLLAAPLLMVNVALAGGQDNDRACGRVENGFQSSVDPYISVVDEQHDSMTTLLTNGDGPNGYSFSKIPDGIGVTDGGCGTLNVFVSHELSNASNHGGFAKVSQLSVNPLTAGVLSGAYPVDGTEGYQRFCSASDVEGYGFEHPVFFANEEVDDGVVVGLDTVTGDILEMPWLGEFSHENTLQIPLFYEEAGLTVVISLEDGDATDSEVYMFVAESPQALLEGDGQLYALGAADPSAFGKWDDIYYSTGSIDVGWVPLEWDWQTQDEGDLHAEAVAQGALRFIRPEDGAMDKRNAFDNVFYFVDTGNTVDENNVAIPNGTNGQRFDKGRMYELVFTDDEDPTVGALRVLLDGNDPAAPGYALMINPDNIDTSLKSVMIQEDRIGSNRPAVTNPYDVTLNAKILRYDLSTGELEVIAYLNQNAAPNARHGDWEASGIIDVSNTMGAGAWLVTVQAHSLNEGGQLLLLEVNGS